MNRPIRVLVVDDSPVARELIVFILGSDPDIAVVATAATGREALEAAGREKPDAITMDIHMPEGNGFEVTRKIMETQPIPIVIVTGSAVKNEVSTAFRAIEAGALAVLAKPVGPGHPEYETRARDLIQTVKLIPEIKLVRRWPRPDPARPAVPIAPEPQRALHDLQVVAIGASTGGPLVLQTILSLLPKNFPLPIVIVQHIARGFTAGFAEWLGETTGFPVQLARQGQSVRPGQAYVAPEELQLTVKAGGSLALGREPPENGLRPSVSSLFRSVAGVYGPHAVGILLTGMGSDGAEELKRMKDRGAITFAQDEASSVVYGMPKKAAELGAADYILPPDRIAATLTELAQAHPIPGSVDFPRTLLKPDQFSGR